VQRYILPKQSEMQVKFHLGLESCFYYPSVFPVFLNLGTALEDFLSSATHLSLPEMPQNQITVFLFHRDNCPRIDRLLITGFFCCNRMSSSRISTVHAVIPRRSFQKIIIPILRNLSLRFEVSLWSNGALSIFGGSSANPCTEYLAYY